MVEHWERAAEIARDILMNYYRTGQLLTSKSQIMQEYKVSDRTAYWIKGYIEAVLHSKDALSFGHTGKKEFVELFITDLHIPYHDPDAVEYVWDYLEKHKIEPSIVVLGGDVIDFYQLSFWVRNPRAMQVEQELNHLDQFLADVRKRFPNASIYYICGNHECVDEESEVLTVYGWKKAKDLCVGEQIFSYATLEDDWRVSKVKKVTKFTPVAAAAVTSDAFFELGYDKHKFLFRRSDGSISLLTMLDRRRRTLQADVYAKEIITRPITRDAVVVDVSKQDFLIDCLAYALKSPAFLAREEDGDVTRFRLKVFSDLLYILDELGVNYKVVGDDVIFESVFFDEEISQPSSYIYMYPICFAETHEEQKEYIRILISCMLGQDAPRKMKAKLPYEWGRRIATLGLLYSFAVFIPDRATYSENWISFDSSDVVCYDLDRPNEMDEIMNLAWEFGFDFNHILDWRTWSIANEEDKRILQERTAVSIECTLGNYIYMHGVRKPIFVSNSRLVRYLYQKAPELSGLSILELERFLPLAKHNIKFIDNVKLMKDFGVPFQINGLYHLHGHEVRTGGIHVARSVYLKLGEDVIFGHFHKTQTYQHKTITNRHIGSYCVGCLCNLVAEYAPVNDWNHGFALIYYDVVGRKCEVQNLVIRG